MDKVSKTDGVCQVRSFYFIYPSLFDKAKSKNYSFSVIKMTIRGIQDKIKEGRYRFSEHAIKRMIRRDIDRLEIEETLMTGEIIEEYPEDKYSPSCLVYGKTKQGRDLHVQVSLPPAVVIITMYEPDPEEWIDGKIRR